jgi:hypothetical protein
MNLTKEEKKVAKKSKTHTIYKTQAGKRVPGVTTITGVLDKPALVPWANRLGLQGIEVRKYVDELAVIGTGAHFMIECHNKGIEPDLGDYTKNQIDLMENAFLKYLQWEKENAWKSEAVEMQLVSEHILYGGTIDMYGTLNGKKTLIDLKTCKAIYPDHHLQVGGGYLPLLRENGHKVEDVKILRIGREDSEGFEVVTVPNLELNQKKFMLCREIYELNKQLRG